MCWWASIDLDEYFDDLSHVIERVAQRQLPLVPCRSKSGGLHLFMFFSEPAPASDVVATLTEVAASLGWAGAEVFPRQTAVLTERGDLPNWMVVPYLGTTYGGKLRSQAALRVSGTELTLGEFLDLAEQSRITAAQLMSLQSPRSSPRPRPARGPSALPPPGGPFGDGPPCLQYMVAAGGFSVCRNETLMHVGVYLRKSHPEDWRAELERINIEHCVPPVESGELLGIIRSLDRKDYQYMCKHEPMASHCNVGVCRTRAHGVGGGEEYPIIGGISKLDTEPPVWFVDIGQDRLELSTEQLQNYTQFHRVAMEVTNRVYMSMRQDMWLRALGAAMETFVLVPAPADLGLAGQFSEMVEDFLTDRRRGRVIGDVLTGRPWEDPSDGRIYFRLRDLQNFLVSRQLRMSRPQIKLRLEKMGGSTAFKHVLTRGVNLWWVHSSAFEAAEEVEVAPPAEPGGL